LHHPPQAIFQLRYLVLQSFPGKFRRVQNMNVESMGSGISVQRQSAGSEGYLVCQKHQQCLVFEGGVDAVDPRRDFHPGAQGKKGYLPGGHYEIHEKKGQKQKKPGKMNISAQIRASGVLETEEKNIPDQLENQQAHQSSQAEKGDILSSREKNPEAEKGEKQEKVLPANSHALSSFLGHGLRRRMMTRMFSEDNDTIFLPNP